MAPFDGKYQNFYLMAIVMFALSLTFARYLQTNAITLTSKMKGKVKKYKNWTWTIRLKMFVSIWMIFGILAAWEDTFTQKEKH